MKTINLYSDFNNGSDTIKLGSLPVVPRFQKINDFLYEATYNTIDYDYANEYFKENTIPVGRCSSVRNGNWYGRNLDYTYDNGVGVIIHTPKRAALGDIPAAFASVGVGYTNRFTRDIVESGTYNEMYRILPFIMADGINENGVFINENVVPRGDKGLTGRTKETGTNPDASISINALTLNRYVLDNFESADDVYQFVDDINVFMPTSLGDDYELHFMIGDENKTYILEFINNAANIIEYTASDKPIMVNFYNTGVTLNTNESFALYSPYTTDDNHSAYNNGITPMGCGMERFNHIYTNYASMNTLAGMSDVLKGVWYSKCYDPNIHSTDKEHFFYGEFVGLGQTPLKAGDSYTVYDNMKTSDGSGNLLERLFENFATKTRENGNGTWITVHMSIYDIENRTLHMINQEYNQDLYTFSLQETNSELIQNLITRIEALEAKVN